MRAKPGQNSVRSVSEALALTAAVQRRSEGPPAPSTTTAGRTARAASEQLAIASLLGAD